MLEKLALAHKTLGDPDFCSLKLDPPTWSRLLALGEAFGWMPHGTIPDLTGASQWVMCPEELRKFEPTYDSPGRNYSKLVLLTDAKALADALCLADDAITVHRHKLFPKHHPILLPDGVTEWRFLESHCDLSPGVLSEFILFLVVGEFTFDIED